jgi:hypothetical protein
MSTSNEPRPWPEHWAIVAAAETDRIENQARIARSGPASARSAAVLAAIGHHLAAARRACHRPGRLWPRRRGLADRWRGASVESAYRNLHAAKEFLVDLLPQAEADALIPNVTTRLGAALSRNDPRRTVAEAALRSRDPVTRRAALKVALGHAYEASDEEYARLRDFRNIIVLTTIGLTLFLGVLLAVVARSPKAIPLCFEPSRTTAVVGAEEQATTVCPSGDRQRPTGGDVLIVAGLGAVGGGLGALFAIRNLRGTSTPYAIPTALALLKVPAGALTAVIGVILLAGGFVPGLSNLDSQRQILAYGLVFGYAQQLITRLVDDQGQQLLDRVPSKDSQATQPTVAVPGVDVGAERPDGTGGEPQVRTDAVPAGGSPPGAARDGTDRTRAEAEARGGADRAQADADSARAEAEARTDADADAVPADADADQADAVPADADATVTEEDLAGDGPGVEGAAGDAGGLPVPKARTPADE